MSYECIGMSSTLQFNSPPLFVRITLLSPQVVNVLSIVSELLMVDQLELDVKAASDKSL